MIFYKIHLYDLQCAFLAYRGMCHGREQFAAFGPKFLRNKTLQSFFCPIKLTSSFLFSRITSEGMSKRQAVLSCLRQKSPLIVDLIN